MITLRVWEPLLGHDARPGAVAASDGVARRLVDGRPGRLRHLLSKLLRALHDLLRNLLQPLGHSLQRLRDGLRRLAELLPHLADHLAHHFGAAARACRTSTGGPRRAR